MRPDPVAAGTANASCCSRNRGYRGRALVQLHRRGACRRIEIRAVDVHGGAGRTRRRRESGDGGHPRCGDDKILRAGWPCWPPTVTVTLPVVAPAGTATVSVVGDALTTTAATPLNATALLAGVALNPRARDRNDGADGSGRRNQSREA